MRKNNPVPSESRGKNIDIILAVRKFLREELRCRYQPKNVRRFRELDALSDTRINTLREFFLTNVYPPHQKRAQIEAAFDHLRCLLHSPGRLRLLLRALAGAFWRLGRQLPAALAVGRSVADAFVRLRDMEDCLAVAVSDMQRNQATTIDRAAMIHAVASLSEAEVESFVRELTHLLEQLSHTDLLRAMVSAIERCKDAMDAHPEIFPEAERAGVALALEIVSGALDIFRGVPASEFALIAKGVMLIEKDWHDRMCREAADGTS